MSISPPPAAQTDTPKRLQPLSAPRLLSLFGPFIGLLLVTLLFSIRPEVREHFLTPENIRLVITQTVIVAIGALGMTLIIISGGIDLSVGSVLALTSVTAAILLRSHQPPWLALLAAVALGSLVGAINGGLITSLRVTPFIVTLGMMGIARGAAKWLGDEQAVTAPVTWLNNLAGTLPNPPWLIVSVGVWITIVLAIVTAIILRATTLGRRIVAIGSNETASRLSGLRVDRLKIVIYSLAGLFFGLAGVLQFARLGGMGDPTGNQGDELDIIAAVVIGGGSLSGGEGSVLGSMLGALIMALLKNGSQQMNWPSYVQQIIIGVVIVVAVALDRLRHRKPTG